MKKVKQVGTLLMAAVLMILCVVPATASDLPFTDVPENYVKYDAIKYVYENGIMNGVSNTLFDPSGLVERAMIVTILYRLEGEPGYYDEPPFTDIDESRYYYDAVCWAYENNIVKGKTATTFEPHTTVSLEEILTFLYRYRAFVDGSDTPDCVLPDPNRMTDRMTYPAFSYTISNFAGPAVNWAVNCGIIADHLRYFDGIETAIRAVCAEYLYKFMTLSIGNGRVLSKLEFEPYGYGPVEYICNRMKTIGYEAAVQYGLYPIAMEYAFYNSEIIYSHSHGTEDGDELVLEGKGAFRYLGSSEIDEDCMMDLQLLYLAACCTGGKFLETAYHVGGAQAVVGFAEPRAFIIGDSEGGAYHFDKTFFKYLSTEQYSIETCCNVALNAMIEKYGANNLYGTDSFVVVGEFG